MRTINISHALNNTHSFAAVVELINEGTCEGMERMKFTSDQLAGQYAYDSAVEGIYAVDEYSIGAQLEYLDAAGACFHYPLAVKHALAINAATLAKTITTK